MKPVPRDDNGHPLLNRGTELFTFRLVGVTTSMSPVTLPTDFKEVMLHVESGPEVIHVTGTVPRSITARLTSSGVSWVVPVSGPDGCTVAHIAAPEGTCNVSIFAWR
ncbi:MAG TPA: hypothetical protein VK463_09640 [Desulfomonilaceae bacterium]|nr:hypothetical protein [Desulfomonilaceae bacterium]